MSKYYDLDFIVENIEAKLDEAIQEIKDLEKTYPLAVSDIRTGKWEQKPYEVTYRCSECKGEALYVIDDEQPKPKFCEFLTNFCPHCGADMRR